MPITPPASLYDHLLSKVESTLHRRTAKGLTLVPMHAVSPHRWGPGWWPSAQWAHSSAGRPRPR